MLTVYGIETLFNPPGRNVLRGVATVLTVYGIETRLAQSKLGQPRVATVLTVYGIET